jgi:hypothetical protein
MQLFHRTHPPWPSGAHISSFVVTSTFLAVIAAVLVAASSGAVTAPREPQAKLAPGEVRADVVPDPDLETVVVEVISQGESVHFQIGSQTAGSALELKKQLEPLARLGGSISVRISHDGPFLHTASAVAACRDAGFATVFLVSGKPSR